MLQSNRWVPWDERICSFAIRNGHLDCFIYAYSRGAPLIISYKLIDCVTTMCDNDDKLTNQMGSYEYMRFIGVKRDMVKRVKNLFATICMPSDLDTDSDTNARWLTHLSYNDIVCLHDDLLRMGHDPYVMHVFAMRILHIQK